MLRLPSRPAALGGALVGWLVLACPARAQDPVDAPLVRIEATVDEHLGVIQGTMTVLGPTPVRIIDPLALLPDPEDDRTARRTWPDLPQRGVIHTVALGEHTWRFTTILPRRYGDVGVVGRRSLLANGQWYPQPMTADGPVLALWNVKVHLPEDCAGSLGDVAGSGTLDWTGWGERASLAVLENGQVTRLGEEGVDLALLTRGRPRAALRERLVPLLAAVRPPEEPLSLVVVEGPLRRRLARPGVGTLYLSDRTFRLTPGLKHFHEGAVTRGLLQASLSVSDPIWREVSAAALTRARPRPNARGLLKWFSWNPVVDAILNDRTLPFWSDVFEAAHPEDPLRDDLWEIHAPHTPGTAIAAQVDDLGGSSAVFSLGSALAQGDPPEVASRAAEVDATLLEGASRPPRPEDWTLQVDASAGHVLAVRDAPEDAPPEVLTIRVDGEDHTQVVGEGPALVALDVDAPKRVVLDPRRHLAQTSRSGDAWPPRFTLTWAAWVDAINPTAGYVDAYGIVYARGRDDTRNIVSAAATVNQQDLPALQLGWLHRRGPLQDGLNRPHRFSAWVAPAWSNPRFAEGDTAVFTLGGGLGYAWDTRVDRVFPLKGRRLGVSVSGGVAPLEGTRWGDLRVAATGLVSWHPRWVLAGQASAGVAGGDTAQQLLWLGGGSGGASLEPGIAVGRLRGVARTEVRWAPIRHASVPLVGLAWLSGVQLTAGAESGWMRTLEDGDAAFVGLTGGVVVVADLLGANPGMGGVTVGIPAQVSGLDVEPWTRPQVTLRFGQAF